MNTVYLLIPLAPLAGAIVAGALAFNSQERGHWAAIPGVGLSLLASLVVLYDVLQGHTFNGPIFTWLTSGELKLEVGFLVDRLTALMAVVVTFVSLLVHIYTIGYMHGDPGYNRFFSYTALFTFFMLMLVMANNFLVLYFGWEGVGLVSYLLIGFWYTRESAITASLKAFLVNRIGDFGFVLGIAAIYAYFGTLDYATVFQQAPAFQTATIGLSGTAWPVLTFATLALFLGAMGKSAQVPLHVWLPDSMEGPTPISALIHAATMVTAGVFMLARLSPLFEYSETALTVVMAIGAITALSMALIGLVQNDIKRVIAYSTLSQLGYMMVAMGVSAYAAGIFHLMTHAFFKALLFLAAGSTIHALLGEQDMRKMGGLRKYMPVTYLTFVIGALALCGIPPFAGYYSKDTIIEATALSHLPGAGYAYAAVLIGVGVTALYTFRMLFMTFHGPERMEAEARDHLHESPKVITVPLVLLAVPSLLSGFFLLEPVIFEGYFGSSLFVASEHRVIHELASHETGVAQYLPVILALAGIGLAYTLYLVRTELPAYIVRFLSPIYSILLYKYGFDELYNRLFGDGTRRLGRLLWQGSDMTLIDGFGVNGTARSIGRAARRLSFLQSGYIYHYAFAMLIGVFVLVSYYYLTT